MFAKLKNYRKLLVNAMMLAPVELVACLIFYVVAVYSYHTDYRVDDWILSLPACFSLIYIVNRLTDKSGVRWLYYVSILAVAGFWWWGLSPGTSRYWITLLISQIGVGLAVKQRGDTAFLDHVLCYVRDMAGALFLAFLGWLLAWGIYTSMIYIFDLDAMTARFSAYSSQVALLLVAPLIFLMFNTRPDRHFTANAFFGVLVNFILSPALLIYNLILYAYFIKIAVLWSLPKGGIAYMVLSFVALFMISKSVQGFLRNRYYDWYYNYFSWWILPPVILLWISSLYRIREYGWTEGRVYLVLTVVMATLTLILFLNARSGRYKWVAVLVAGGFALFTYIPGINAEALGVYSQERRMERIIPLLYSQQEWKWTKNTDSLTLQRYKILYNSARYVRNIKGDDYVQAKFGFTERDMASIIPEEAMEWGEPENDRNHIFLSYEENQSFPIAGFDTLEMINWYRSEDNLYFKNEGSRLLLYDKEKLFIDIDMNPFFREKLAENGVDTAGLLTQELLEGMKSVFQTYEQGNIRIVLEAIGINARERSVYRAEPRFLLKRKEE